MMETLEQLETHEGFLYNWYYLSGRGKKPPEVTLNRFVSSLDNGDLDICLMATAGAFQQTELSKRIERFLAKKDYHFFFNNWPFAGFYEINLFNHNRLSNFVSIAFAQGSKGNSAPLSEGLISLESLKNGCPLRVEKPAKGQLIRIPIKTAAE